MRRSRPLLLLTVVALLASLGAAPAGARAAGPIGFTILHTNDFHGQLEPSGSNPGMARVAKVANDVRGAKGAANVLLVDAGDEMQGSLLSNLQKGAPTIATFNAMQYDVATYGNHEFDWGQTVLGDRVAQSTFPHVSANIVVNDTGNCATAGWTAPSFVSAPWAIRTVGTAPDTVDVAFIGVTTQETPTITIASATAGICFKDPADSILHYYDAMKTAGADVVVVLSHLGFNDGGYGYGMPVYGDKTLATKLTAAGKPANLIVGGHSHTNMASSGPTVLGPTTIAQAYYGGRQLGQADVTFDPGTGATTVAWKTNAIATSAAEDPAISALVTGFASDPAYQALINQPVGYVQTDLLRDYNGDSMMGDFVDDAIYGALNGDAIAANDVDLFLNNAGGIRADWCDAPDPLNPGQYLWSGAPADCQPGVWAHGPMLLNYGQMFSILPFGNATAVGTMTGAQVLELLNQSATLFKGAIQPSGIRFKFYRYSDALPGPQPWAWGAYDAEVWDKGSSSWQPLDVARTYKVGTNEFLAPAGQDGYLPFKYLANITYWGDMLDAVNAYVSATYTAANPYKGPNGDGMLDGRITRDGTDAGGSIAPVTILHHNDSHGNLAKGTYVGYTQLATLIKQERAHNPARTLLLSGGDNIQGDAMSYYFKSAPLGYAADGTPLAPPLQVQPLIAAFNAMGYDAMDLGNHEFNFGNIIFQAVLAQATFPILGANVADDGRYGLAAANGGAGVRPYIEKTVGPEGIKVAILGITNHRVPNYELPSNILGLTFGDPLAKAQQLATALRPTNDAVVALTHIGFTEDPKSVEVDKNVDTNMAMTVSGLDAIIGSHSHTNPATGSGAYKFLPTIIGGPASTPVLVTQAYRYNNTLGEVVLGFRAKAGGGYELVSRAGKYLSVTSSTPEDPAVKAIVDPYVAALSTYNNTVLGQTTVPIDALEAFTQETNAANLQADAAIFELNKNGITPDVHLSGAMTNKAIATSGPYPVTLKVADMFTLMPYENSLVVLRMNGPQLKKVLERAYRNYYFYKYVPGYGGYSRYTTCMLDTSAVGQITYNDLYPAAYDPTKSYVVSLKIGANLVDFSDASTYYKVSTVNYLAAGSCNFNDGGVSLWPLDQIVNDTQYYVRDAVIDYVKAMGTVSPAIEGRLQFIYDVDPPVITISSPTATSYLHSASLTLDFGAEDVGAAGLLSVTGDLDGTSVVDGQVIDLVTLALGSHTLTVAAVDRAGNAASASVTFSVKATVNSIKTLVYRFYAEHKITNPGIRTALLARLFLAQAAINVGMPRLAINQLNAFIHLVQAQSGKSIQKGAATILIADARFVIASLK